MKTIPERYNDMETTNAIHATSLHGRLFDDLDKDDLCEIVVCVLLRTDLSKDTQLTLDNIFNQWKNEK